jgi:putative phosphonate catabolism associated alcohol dehydrogenase
MLQLCDVFGTILAGAAFGKDLYYGIDDVGHSWQWFVMVLRNESDIRTIAAQRMLFQGPGTPHVMDRSEHAFHLQEGDTLVEISMATICGSDLHTHLGRRSCPTPAVLGHEGVGVVLQLGQKRDPSLLGQRVTWTLTDSCGHCAPCAQWQLPQKCDSLFKYGHASLEEGQGFAGCFASHIVLRKGTAIFEIPDVVSDAVAVPANCALATMVAVVDALSQEHQTVLIQGAGLLGLYGAALLHAQGKQVLIADLEPHRVKLAEKFGAEACPERLQPNSMDAVIEVAGTSAVIAEGIRVLRPGGFYGLAGLVHPESALNLTGEQLIRKCLTIRGFHNYAAANLAEGLQFLEDHRATYPWEELVSDPMSLRRLDEAFELAASRQWSRVAVSPKI